jgi:hypothetical protein
MMKILNDRANFYQWDLEQKLEIEDRTITEVHFNNAADTEALVCEVYEQDGKKLVNVPNILLQQALDIRAYAYCGNCYTKQCERYKVIARAKPTDYVYTETEVRTLEDLEARVDALEAGGGSGGGSAIKDGQLLLNGGLEIRTTNPWADGAPTNNYIKIGENIDENEPLTIKGWDTKATFSHDDISLIAGNNGLYVSRSNPTKLSGEYELNIEAPLVTISGDDIQVVRNGELTPNSVISKNDLDEALSGIGGGSAEDKANLEITPIGIYIGSNIYDLRVGSGIYTLEEIQEADNYDYINYILVFDSGNIVFYVNCATPEEFAAYGFVVGGNYRLTIDLGRRSIDKVERVIDLKDKVNKTDFEAAIANVGGLKEYELLSDTTITEDVAQVKFTTTDNGEPISNYKDFFLFFCGKFTAEESKPIWCKSEGQYFMYHGGLPKKTSVRGFWISIEQLFATDAIDCHTASSRNGTAIFISKFPVDLLENFSEGNISAQGLSGNNKNLRSDTTIMGTTDLPLKELVIGQAADATAIFASGSRFLLLGRKA